MAGAPLIQKKALRVLMAAGGTGGHIFPALAVAQELRARWQARERPGAAPDLCRIEFAGTGRGLETRVIPAAGFPLHTVAAAGLKGIGGFRKIRNLLVLPRSFWDTAKLLYHFRPHVVVGAGGYVAGPVMLEAALSGIPTLLIEPNAAPGFTNRALAPFVRLAVLGFEEAAPVYGKKARVTGHPVRSAFSHIAARQSAAPFNLLILGGSQGSLAINNAILGALPLFAQRASDFNMIHQTGERCFERVRQAYAEAGLNSRVHAFIDDVPLELESADLVICRSGASTVAELAAAGRASLLIPFPAATDNHQLANAKVLEQAGGARVLEQRELTPERLFGMVTALTGDPAGLTEMGRCARRLAHPNAAREIAELIEGLAEMNSDPKFEIPNSE